MDDKTVWVAGGDRRVYRGPVAGGKFAPIGPTFDAPINALALLPDDRLAVLAGAQLAVLAWKDGKALQMLELPEPGSSLAADPTGRWVVAGTSKGTACVFDSEDKDTFLLGETAKLHEGAITALLFEPDELRFLSAGADGRLLSTHARGKLEPEDKGRGNNHADTVSALLWTTPPDRLISGGRDGTIKNWPRAGATKPATVKDAGKAVGLAFVQVHTRTVLVAAGEDNVLRFLPLDPAAMRLGDVSHRAYGAAEWAKHELAQSEPRRREAALRQLADWNDTPAVEAVANQMSADADHALRLVAAQLLSASTHPRAAKLLEKALSHPDEAVRVAAFHGLRKHLGPADLHPLNLALSAGWGDVGRLAVEALALLAAKDDQALSRLVAALNSSTPEVRPAALAALERVHDPKSPEADLVALGSRHADLRRLAQALLATVLADEDKDLRQQALDALVGDDVHDALHAALDSPHDDVHAKAAKALARHGDPAALKPLIALVAAPEPAGAEQKATWVSLVETALDGLAELGDPAALPHVEPLLNSAHANVRKSAGWALAWAALGQHPGSLRQAMQHADPQVKYHAAYGLALGGEASAAPLVFSPEGGKVLPAKERAAAALALGPAGEDQLVAMLDHHDERARTHALLLLMLLELKASGGTPSRCLAALACREPRVRLRAARGVDNFRDPDAFLQYVTRLFDDRGGIEPKDNAEAKKPWDISAAVVETVAELIAHGPPPVRARTARLLSRLFEEDQSAWDRAWAVHAARFANDITALRSEAAKRKPAPPQYTPEQLEELAFGAYVGLVREQGGSYSAKDRPAVEPHVARVRQTALSWVLELARRNPARFAKPAQAVCVQALTDPNFAVRLQAFEQLQTLGMDPTALGAEALEAGHKDLGVRGLELLSGGSKGAKGQAVLEQAMLSRTDDLAIEAAKLLTPHRGAVAVAASALAAAHEPLRRQAVLWLAAEYDKSDEAKQRLRGALASRYAAVREQAALELAAKKDPAAFEVLVRLLAETHDAARQRAIVAALEALGDPRAPDAFLDRLEHDPSGTAQGAVLLRAAGSFRRPETAGRLLALMEQKKWREAAAEVTLWVSGYDQPILDPEDERPDREWERKQFPRHDAVLAQLAERLAGLNEVRLLTQQLSAVRWARGKEVDPILARLAAHHDDRLRRDAVEAIGWRVRKRGSSPDALRAALAHRDPTTQFLAAEGLARAGRGEGLSVLLSAIDFLQDLDLRRRAVRALGELGDARALDPLLKLANEDGHALQEEAAEAIGHLGRSGHADEVFKLLERFAKGPAGGVARNALRGLRWLNTHAAWQVIRTRAADEEFLHRDVAVAMLGHNDDPATRDLLLRLLAEGAFEVQGQAIASARRLFGPDSLEPDYALMGGEYLDAGDEDVAAALRRVAERGEPGRVFELLAQSKDDDVKKALAVSLLNRTPPPAKEAAAALAGDDATAVRVAARVLGRAGSVSKEASAAVGAAVRRWRQTWDAQRRTMRARAENDWDGDDELTNEVAPALEALLWAAGRLGSARHRTHSSRRPPTRPTPRTGRSGGRPWRRWPKGR